MRSTLVLAVLALAGCGDSQAPKCAVSCVDSCPDSMTCSAGFCAEPGATCEPDFETVQAGTGFACALDQFHRNWCWGSNENHQIAGAGPPQFERAVVSGDRRWDSIALGGGHICALEDGELWCWGKNDRNQVSSAVVGDVILPVRIEVPGVTVTWSYVSTGYDYTCGIGNGRLFCWGANSVGKLGIGGVDDSPFPQLVDAGVVDWVSVATGMRHTCAVSKTQGVFCWGDGSFGELGNGRFDVLTTPQQVALTDATSIAIGMFTTCAVTGAGELFCWGRAAGGALGDPDSVGELGDSSTPVLASALGGWLEVASAEHYACARRDGEVWCWGTALAGGLGDGRWQSTTWTRVLDNASSLDVGWNATDGDFLRDDSDADLTCAITGGAISCWGDNRAGQLGQGGATRSDVPLAIAGDHTWSALAAGDAHACGIASGDVQCWGSVERGQVAGVVAGRTNPCTADACDEGAPVLVAEAASAISAGATHTCALRGSAVTCWGDNTLGQSGGAPLAALPPTDLPGTWSALHSGGANGGCAVKGTETWCWGEALASHEPAHEPALDGLSAIVLGAGFGCALDQANELACFGDPLAFGNGALGTCGDDLCNAGETAESCNRDCGPGPLTHLGRSYRAPNPAGGDRTIDAGGAPFVCAVRLDGGIECWGDNKRGQSGQLDEAMQLVHPVITPFAIPGLAGCTQVATGGRHACAICGGALACWGDAEHGELGAPITRDPITTPRTIAAPADDVWAEVTAGEGFTCARTQSGKGYCWGTSLHGALGNGATGANLPVTVQR